MDWWTGFDKKMADYLPDLKIAEEPMSRHTSFRIGGPARRMAFPTSGAQLVLLMSFCPGVRARPLVIVAGGTNLLCPDEGVDRLVMRPGLARLEPGAEPTRSWLRPGCLGPAGEFARQRRVHTAWSSPTASPAAWAACMNAGAYDER